MVLILIALVVTVFLVLPLATPAPMQDPFQGGGTSHEP